MTRCSSNRPVPSSLLRDPLLDAERVGVDQAHRLKDLPRQAVDGKSQADVAAVADDPDVVTIGDVVAFGTAGDERFQEAIDGVGDALGLGLAQVAAESFGHRARLVDEEEETGGVGPADFRHVRHHWGSLLSPGLQFFVSAVSPSPGKLLPNLLTVPGPVNGCDQYNSSHKGSIPPARRSQGKLDQIP